MARSHHSKRRKHWSRDLKQFGNARLRARIQTFIKKFFQRIPGGEIVPSQKENGDPWDWD